MAITSSPPQSFSYIYWEEDDGVIVMVIGPVLSCSCEEGASTPPPRSISVRSQIPLLECGDTCHLLFSVLDLGHNSKTQKKPHKPIQSATNQLLDKTEHLTSNLNLKIKHAHKFHLKKQTKDLSSTELYLMMLMM